jgi:uncharacterized protein
MHVKELWIYPIKSCRGIPLKTAEVNFKGLKWDREFMIVDASGKFITQRHVPEMAQITVEVSAEQLFLSYAGNNSETLEFIPNFEGQEKQVQVWADQTIAIDQGDRVAQWLQKVLDLSDIRLVRQSPQYIRPIDPKYAHKENEPVSFADGYPMLLTNTASLEELNRRIGNQTVQMNRFRPNIVVETTSPFLEDQWRYIRIGGIEFNVIKACSRCIITTTDQKTGQRDPEQEPLRTLQQFRNSRGQVLFGENLVPLNTGNLKLDDPVEVARTKNS